MKKLLPWAVGVGHTGKHVPPPMGGSGVALSREEGVADLGEGRVRGTRSLDHSIGMTLFFLEHELPVAFNTLGQRLRHPGKQ